MIVLDLVCSAEHRFEGWFAGRTAFDEQRERRLVACPVCGDSTVGIVLSPPRIGGTRSNARMAPPSPTPREMLGKIAAMQAALLPKSTWVGGEFADKARAMAEGIEPSALIHGQASADEARALREDGIDVLPLLVPIVPPEQQN